MTIHVPGETTLLHETTLRREGLTRAILYCDRGTVEPSLAVIIKDAQRGPIGGQVISARFAHMLADASCRVATGELGECGRIPLRNGPAIVVSVGNIRGRTGIVLCLEWEDGRTTAPTVLVEDDELDAFDRGVAMLSDWRRP